MTPWWNKVRASHHLRAGLRLAERNLFEAAIGRYRKALSLDESNAAAHLHLGRALAATGDRTATLAATSRAIEMRPRAPAFLILAGEALLDIGEPHGAQELFVTAARLNPVNELAHAYAILAAWRTTPHARGWPDRLRQRELPDSTSFLCRLLMTVEQQLRHPKMPRPFPAPCAAACPPLYLPWRGRVSARFRLPIPCAGRGRDCSALLCRR